MGGFQTDCLKSLFNGMLPIYVDKLKQSEYTEIILKLLCICGFQGDGYSFHWILKEFIFNLNKAKDLKSRLPCLFPFLQLLLQFFPFFLLFT